MYRQRIRQLPRVVKLPSTDHHHLTAAAGHLPTAPRKRNLTASHPAAMRLPYVDPSTSTALQEPAAAAVVERVRARRAPRPLQALDLALLHSPAIADGWNSFIGAVRQRTTLGDDIREIAICRVALINQAWYEWFHHAPLAQAGGVSEAGMKLLEEERPEAPLEGEGGLTEKQWAVVRYTDAMTRDIRVSDEVFDALRKSFNEQEIVEITATVASYNCVSRFLVALDVGEKNSTKGP